MTKPGESALCRAFKHLRYGGLIQLMRLLMILPILLIAGAAEAGGLIPADLRCEYRTNPLGIDSARPRLFWLLKSLEQGSRNQRQTAYQIIVATSKKALDAGKGDLWDSGKRSSGQSAQIEYGGRQLGSRQQCHWKVRVWDENGEPSAWSAPSHWSMGLLDGADWKAHWAGAGCSSPRDGLTPEQSERVSLREAPWIWHPGPDARQDAPKGRVYLRKGFDAPAGLERALLAIVADDAYLVTINGQAVGETSVRSDRNWQHYQVIDVTRTIRSGRNLLAIRAENTGGSAGAAARLFLFGAGAEPEVISLLP